MLPELPFADGGSNHTGARTTRPSASPSQSNDARSNRALHTAGASGGSRDPDPVMVSVIVPVFNGADVLPRLLNALTTQTYPQQWTEILIVDNNSTDNTADVV